MIRPRPARDSSSANAASEAGGRSAGGVGGHRGWRRPLPQQGAQRGQANSVKGAQRHFVARQGGQRIGKMRQRIGPQLLDGLRHRVLRIAGMEHPVDRQALVGQPELSQFVGGACSLLQRLRVRPGDQHHRGQRRVAQRAQRGVETRLLHLQPRVRAQAGSAAVIARQKPGPGLGQAQQAQRVAGGRCVEDHMVERTRHTGIRQQCREFVERGDLGGAGPRELLAHRGAFLVRGSGLQLRKHALPVGLCRGVGVDVEHLQTPHTRHVHRAVGQRNAQHLVEVGRRVGADQEHPSPGVGQRDGGGGGQ